MIKKKINLILHDISALCEFILSENCLNLKISDSLSEFFNCLFFGSFRS